MQEHKFNEILDFLCKDIMLNKERQNVRDELYDHLMCKYETNLAVGLDDEQAEKKAVEELGDISLLRFKLGQVHSYAPKPTMKKAMNLLIVGYLLISFHVNFFTGMEEITKFIGNVIMLVGMFCMSKANKRLKQAFIIEATAFAISALSESVTPLFGIFYLINIVNAVVSMLNLISMILLLIGLSNLTEPYKSTFPQKIPFVFSGFMYVITQGYVTLLLSSAVTHEKKIDLDFTGDAALIVFPIVIISLISTLTVLIRVSKCLWQSDHEYKIEDSSAKKKIAAFLAVIIAVVPTVAVDVYTATRKAVTSVHTIEDYELSQSEYQRITNNLLSYGIPEKVIYNLPKSEIINYSASWNKLDFSESVQNSIGENAIGSFSNTLNNGAEYVFHNCAIGMYDDEGHPMIRMLCWIEYTGSGKGYNDAIFFEYPGNRFIKYNDSYQYENNFSLILSEENDEILKNESIDVYYNYKSYAETASGFSFETKDKLLIIFAENLGINTMVEDFEMSNYAFNYVQRNFPLAYPYRTPYDFKEKGVYTEGLGFKRISGFTMYAYTVPEKEKISTEENINA